MLELTTMNGKTTGALRGATQLLGSLLLRSLPPPLPLGRILHCPLRRGLPLCRGRVPRFLLPQPPGQRGRMLIMYNG